MAFLDNSGDIILDAVITDTGRFRLAKGDGSFKIVKYALGDDEIDYANYDKNNASGSAYYDLAILQTPILEAFTNNTSNMKSKLISIPRTNLLYLPVIKLYKPAGDNTEMHSSNIFVIAVDEDTVGTNTTGNTAGKDGLLHSTAGSTSAGILDGFKPANGSSFIRLDEGLDTTEIPSTFTIDADLNETQYIIEIDNRLGAITKATDGVALSVSFIDDDNVASYFVSRASDPLVVYNLEGGNAASSIAGPRGTKLTFKVRASVELGTSTYLFEKLGASDLEVVGASTQTCRYIDSIIKVTGATTGYRVDVPVRFVKKQ